MLKRYTFITIAVCLLAALPVVVFQYTSEASQKAAEQELVDPEAAGKISVAEAGAPEYSSRLDQGSWLLYVVFFGVCLLTTSLFIHYAVTYKAAVQQNERVACTV